MSCPGFAQFLPKGSIKVVGLAVNLLWRYIRALLHERAYGEPERVHEGELVLEDSGLSIARMGILPLVRAEPADTSMEKGRD